MAIPTDALGNDLVRTYLAGARRLESLVNAALKRGLDPSRIGTDAQVAGDASAAYRARQLAAARSMLDELERTARTGSPRVAAAAYRAAVVAVDGAVIATGAGRAAALGAFGRLDPRPVQVLSANLERSLTAAARNARTNVESVFARANLLEGALPTRGEPLSGFPFIGRRLDDPWRRVALEQIGAGTVALDTREQISKGLAARLITDGVTDATTGFVDSGGARWGLDRYAAMVVRTTTREATTRGAVARMDEHGLDVVTISSHAGACEICADYDGNTYSLNGDTPGLEVLGDEPPFHPNCEHVITPGEGNMDNYLAALQAAVSGTGTEEDVAAAAGEGATAAAAATVREGPFSTAAVATRDASSLRRARAADRVDAFADPGAEAGADAARRAWQDAQAGTASKAARSEARRASRAVDEALGPDLSHALEDFAKSGVTWARDDELKRALIAGDLTIDDVAAMAERELAEREGRRVTRLEQEEGRGLQQRSFPCFVCGRFKRRPADVCPHCGDDPVSYHGDAHEFNRAYGYRD